MGWWLFKSIRVGHAPGLPSGPRFAWDWEHTLWDSSLIVSMAHSSGVWVWQALLVPPTPVRSPRARSSQGISSSPWTSHQDPLRVHHSQAEPTPGTCVQPARRGLAGPDAMSAHTVPSQCLSSITPLLSGSSLLGLRNSPAVSYTAETQVFSDYSLSLSEDGDEIVAFLFSCKTKSWPYPPPPLWKPLSLEDATLSLLVAGVSSDLLPTCFLFKWLHSLPVLFLPGKLPISPVTPHPPWLPNSPPTLVMTHISV